MKCGKRCSRFLDRKSTTSSLTRYVLPFSIAVYRYSYARPVLGILLYRERRQSIRRPWVELHSTTGTSSSTLFSFVVSDRTNQVNYRHFEDDMNPRVFKKEGLKHLDRVIDLVRPFLFPPSRYVLIPHKVCKIRHLHYHRLARRRRCSECRLA